MNRIWLNVCRVSLAALSLVVCPAAALAVTAAREPAVDMVGFREEVRTNFQTWRASRETAIGQDVRFGVLHVVAGKSAVEGVPGPIYVRELVDDSTLTRDLRHSVAGWVYQTRGWGLNRRDPTDRLFVFRHDAIEAQGVEFALERRFSGALRLRSSYLLQQPVFATPYEQIAPSPLHTAKFAGLVPLYDTTTYGGVEVQYLSELKTQTGHRTPRFLLTSLTLHTRAFGRGIEISVTASNLFNKHYSFPASTGHVQDTIPQSGRSLRVKLTYRF